MSPRSSPPDLEEVDFPADYLDDSDDPELLPGNEADFQEIVRRRNAFALEGPNARAAAVIDLTGPDTEALIELELQETFPDGFDRVDISGDNQPRGRASRSRVENRRNPDLDATHRRLQNCVLDDVTFRHGDVLELAELLGPHRIQYLKVSDIFENMRTGQIHFRGVAYTRTRNLHHYIIPKLNEVCELREIEEDDPRDSTVQSLVEVQSDEVLRTTRCLLITNDEFPKHRCEPDRGPWKTKREIEERAQLVCRSRCTIYYIDASMRKKDRQSEQSIEFLREKDVPKKKFRSSDKGARVRAIGDYLPGGSHIEGRSALWRVFNIDENNNDWAGENYTYGDTFCGAGGASRGAHMAGLRVVFGMDHWIHACATYRHNFPNTKLFELDVFDFVLRTEVPYRIDILHLSPPCQVYSPAHTVEGQNDDANVAVLYSCTELIKKITPRVFTLEQTFGLLHARFTSYFEALVQGFTVHGYSIRWRVVNLATWGLPQKRRRLIMIGACAGEELPSFPEPTHSNDPESSLPRFVSAKEATRNIRNDTANHNLDEVRDKPRQPPWDGDSVIPRTITTNGGQNYHWSGKRGLTLREYAALQGFPNRHVFVGSYVKKQIGNAFPPCVVSHLLTHIKKGLERVDGVKRVARSALPQPAHQDTVDLTTLDDDAGRPATISGTTTRPVKKVKKEAKNGINGNLSYEEALEKAMAKSRADIKGKRKASDVVEIHADGQSTDHQSRKRHTAVMRRLSSLALSEHDDDMRRAVQASLKSAEAQLISRASASNGEGPSNHMAIRHCSADARSRMQDATGYERAVSVASTCTIAELPGNDEVEPPLASSGPAMVVID